MASQGWDRDPDRTQTCRNSTEMETKESKLVGPRRRAAQDQLRAAKRLTLEPQAETVIPVNCSLSGLRILEPDGALYGKMRVSLAHGAVSIRSDVPFNVKIANFGDVPVIVQKGEILDRAIESPIPSRILAIDLDSPVEGCAPRPASESTTKASIEDADLSHLNAVERTRVRSMLAPFASMWNGQLGLSRTTEHTIDLVPGAHPVFTHPYTSGPEQREVIREIIEDLLKKRIASILYNPSGPPPIVLVPKSDGNLRFCVDYRRLNALTVKDTYPIPRIDDCIDSLGDAALFTTLDCNSGY